MVKNILLLLFASICISAAAQTPKFKLVTIAFSKGTSDGKEYIEMMVVGRKSCTEDSGIVNAANLSNFVIYDSHGDSTYSNGDKGLASGYYSFPKNHIWDSVPYGSIITIYNGKNKNTAFLYNDDTTGTTTIITPTLGAAKTISADYIIPDSLLQLMPVRDTTPSPDSSNLPSPASLVVPDKTDIYLGNEVDSPYLNIDSSVWINSWRGPYLNGTSGAGKEDPGTFASDSVQAWSANLQINKDFKAIYSKCWQQ